MREQVNIAVIGDFDLKYLPHAATRAAFGHAARALGGGFVFDWIVTTRLMPDAGAMLAGYHGIHVAPGSPYADVDGVLEAIAYARTAFVPLLAAGDGFAQVALEFARAGLGLRDACHAEYDPAAPDPLIAPRDRPHAAQRIDVLLREGTMVRLFYRAVTAREPCGCRFGLDPAAVPLLEAGGLIVTGSDAAGEACILELPRHPFFLATLFVPGLGATAAGRPHPLMLAFLRAARAYAGRL